jgi:hypothetical protein
MIWRKADVPERLADAAVAEPDSTSARTVAELPAHGLARTGSTGVGGCPPWSG